MLIVFHHAGGAASFYGDLAKAFPSNVEVVMAELPGRGRRVREEPLTDFVAVVKDLTGRLEPAVSGRTVAGFGHSMGSYVGLHVLERLERRGVHVLRYFASGNAGPSAFLRRPTFDVAAWTDQELTSWLARTGTIPSNVSTRPGLVEMLLPAFRADYAVCKSIREHATAVRLERPVTAMGGDCDVWTREELATWREASTASFDMLVFRGDHFYFRSRPEEVAGAITGRLVGIARDG